MEGLILSDLFNTFSLNQKVITVENKHERINYIIDNIDQPYKLTECVFNDKQINDMINEAKNNKNLKNMVIEMKKEITFEKNTYEELNEFRKCVNPIRNISTDFVNEYGLREESNILWFLLIIYVTIDKALDLYKQKHGLNESQIKFIYKGGNCLRAMFIKHSNTLSYNMKKEMYERYKDVFKKSDVDTTIKIDPTLDDDTFKKHYENVQTLIFVILQHIRHEYMNDGHILNFNTYNNEFIEKICEKYKINFQNTINELQKKCDYYNDMKILDFCTLNKKVDPVIKNKFNDKNNYDTTISNNKALQLLTIGTLTSDPNNLHSLNKRDYGIIQQNDKHYIKYFKNYVDQNSIYIYWNELIGEKRNVTHTKFALIRMKLNAKLYYEKNSKVGILDIGGELLDVSFTHKDASEATMFDDNDYEQFIFVRDNITLKILSFGSLNYTFDIIKMIYIDVEYKPWTDSKYIKRIKRLEFLYLIYCIEHKVNINDIKQFILNVKNRTFINTNITDNAIKHFLENNKRVYTLNIKDNQIETDNYMNIIVNTFEYIEDFINRMVESTCGTIYDTNTLQMGGDKKNMYDYKYKKYKHKYLNLT